MAIVRNNPILAGLSGSIGKQITFRQLAGRTVVSKYRGPSSVPATDAQLSVRGRFAKAVDYARKAKSDEALARLYKAAASPGHSAYHLALRDALSAPAISDMKYNHSSRIITLTATDIIQVHTVTVSVGDAEGRLLEVGPAKRKPGTDEWQYRISSNHSRIRGVQFTALARDYPGNSTLRSGSLEGILSLVLKPQTIFGSIEPIKIVANSSFFVQMACLTLPYVEKRAREPDSSKRSLNLIGCAYPALNVAVGSIPENHSFKTRYSRGLEPDIKRSFILK